MFTSDPVWCEITYSYTITNLAGDAAISFNIDPIVREFNFDYSVDLNLCGLTSIDYLVTVVGKVGITVKQSDFVPFTLTLKNPCIDSNYVTIEADVLLN